MLKKLDWYTIKTFIGPFIFIFSILFFIFIVQFAWQELESFAGKGLSWFTIAKLLFYLGINVVQIVLPLTILLGSIMTFGGFGERYELAAMKASGISLFRVMTPLISFICLLSIGLYFFGDSVMPYSQKKAKNLLFNIFQTQPALNLREGVFIENIPGYSMRIHKITGENQEFLEDVFIHTNTNYNQDKQTIVSQKGILAKDNVDPRYLKLELTNGYIYTDDAANKNITERKRQPNKAIQFDTMNLYMDITELMEKELDEENINNHYKFLNGKKLSKLIDSTQIVNDSILKKTQEHVFTRNIYLKDNNSDSLAKAQPFLSINSLNEDKKKLILKEAIANIEREKINFKNQGEEIKWRNKIQAKSRLHLHRNLSYAFTCIVFFLIGAPLGAIVKKGGIGMPVIISIIIFVIYYIINFSAENMNKNGTIHPIFAAWVANIVFFPISVILFYKANNDSGLFNVSNYTDPIIKLFNKIIPNKKRINEHSRYQ